MEKGWLRQKLTVEEAEAQNTVTNHRLGPEPVPFGFDNAAWKNVIAQIQPGDELWQFASDAQSWRDLAGRAGISLVRNGEVVTSIVTMMN
jgi:hypothetical protein